MNSLSSAAQRLLRELARRDEGDGAEVRYSGRGRWYLSGGPSAGELFLTRTVPLLYEAGLALGWTEDSDERMRITPAGRKVAAQLREQDKAERAAKAARPGVSPDGPAARRLLAEIATFSEPAAIYDDGRRAWSVGSRDGHRASVTTWMALAKAGLISIERVSSIGGHRVMVTDAGRERLK